MSVPASTALAQPQNARAKPHAVVNGAQRGWQLELRPDDLVAALAPIIAAPTG